MSRKYESAQQVPTVTLAARLGVLSSAVTQGREAVSREFTMRAPAELDRDADLVLSEAAFRLIKHDAEIAALHAAVIQLSRLCDEQRSLLVDVEDICGRDGHGGEFEDGESEIIDRVRAHLAATNSAETANDGSPLKVEP